MLGLDLQNNKTKISSPLIGQFSLFRGFTKKFCLSIGKIFVVLLFFNPTPISLAELLPTSVYKNDIGI